MLRAKPPSPSPSPSFSASLSSSFSASFSPPLFAQRYERVGVIGRGATGTVYRAVDRLNRRVVALKTVAADPALVAPTSDLTMQSTRASALLASEFRLLAGLRHPNVITCLDFGFDDAAEPFFTMDLPEDARSLREAAAGASPARIVDLLVQLLHALAYMHRRGLVHRDVKPENALCAGGVVKLIDLGLAVSSGDGDDATGGTLAYAAPEVLRGAPADERADLYAVGIMAYEMLAGCHPFDVASRASLLRSVLLSKPDLAKPGIDAALAPVIGRLLARDRAERFADAHDVISAMAQALERPLPVETSSTRESFLHGAALVGRDSELARLKRALPDGAVHDRVLLVGGESGVGKSRLLEELTVEAMVRGVRVLRGQALREGSRPYEPWHAVLRLLALFAEPSDLDVAVLAEVVPDVAALLGRVVPAAAELDPAATHLRLVRVFETLLRRCPHPLLIVLEDLHWAGTESLKLLARVQTLAPEVRVLVVGSYRSDERPGLPGELARGEQPAECVELSRLSATDVTRLCASILGEHAHEAQRSAALGELLVRESNGNVLVVLELLRALAHEAGGLEHVHALSLDERRFAGRLEGLVRERVERLSEEDRAFLRSAAVAGRELDLRVLAKLHGGLDLEACAARAVEASVLASAQGRWWFAHDRLRDALLEALPDDLRRRLHRELAEAITSITPGHAATLAHHFGAAGDLTRERELAAVAGGQFLRSGAYHEAVPYLRRALELSGDGLARAVLQRQLGEALFRSGQLAPARTMLADALASLGRPLPAGRPRFVARLLGEAARQVALRARRTPPAAPAAPEVERSEEAILAYTQLSRLAHHLNDEHLVLLVTLSALNLSERASLHAHHTRLCAVMGAVMGIVPVHRWARFYFATARAKSASLDDPSIEAMVLAHEGYYEAGIGEWRACREHLERSMALYDGIGDVRLREESVSILAYALFFKGDTRESLELYEALERSGEERQDRQIMSWGLTNRMKVLVRSRSFAQARELLTRVDQLLVDGITRAVRDGAVVELETASDDLDTAFSAARAAAERIEESAPRSFMACSTYAAIADALLACWAAAEGAGVSPARARELRRAAARANGALAKVSRVFPIAEPARLLHEGTFALLRGRPARARVLWERAERLAAEREMPREEALAKSALARLTPKPARPATPATSRPRATTGRTTP